MQKKFHVSSTPLYSFLIMFCVMMATRLPILSGSVYNQKRIIQIAVLILFSLILSVKTDSVKKIAATLVNLPFFSRLMILLVFIFGICSSIMSLNPEKAFQEIALFGMLFLFTLYIKDQLSLEHVQKVVLFLIGFGIFLYGWRFFINYAWRLWAVVTMPAISLEMLTEQFSLFPGFVHPRFLNQIQSWTLPLLATLPAFFASTYKTFKWVLWIPGIMGWVPLFVSGGRGTVISMISCTIACTILFKKQSGSWLKTHATFALSGFLIYLILFKGLPGLFHLDLETMAEHFAYPGHSGRLAQWKSALQLALESPFFGIGPHQFANLELPSRTVNFAGPHSALFQLLCELGMISFVFIGMIMSFGLFKWIRFYMRHSERLPENHTTLIIGLTASFTAGATHSLVSGVIVMPLSQMLGCLVIGWMMAVYARHTQVEKTLVIPKLVYRYAVFFLLLTFIIILIYSIYPDILHLDKLHTEFKIRHPDLDLNHPRFWNQGLFEH